MPISIVEGKNWTAWKIVFVTLLAVWLIIGSVSATPTYTDAIGFKWNTSDPSPTVQRVFANGTPANVDGDYFNNHVIWGNMKRVLVNSSTGVVTYGTNNRGDGLDLNGTLRNQVMTEIPMFYSFESYTAPYMTYIISPTQYNSSFAVHPMFNQRGDGKPAAHYYVGAYEMQNETVGSTLTGTSYTGKTPVVSQNISTMRTYAEANGPGWGLMNIWTLSGIRELLYIEMGTLNSQTAWANSRGVVDATAGKNAGADSADTNIWATNATGGGTGVNGKTPVVFHGLQDVWGNRWEFGDGQNSYRSGGNSIWRNINRTGLNTTGGRTKFQDLLIAGDYETSTTLTVIVDGYQKSISTVATDRLLMIPTEVGGSESTYFADNFYYPRSTNPAVPNILLSGGAWDGNWAAGIGYLFAVYDASTSREFYGARLEFRPQNTITADYTISNSSGIEPLLTHLTDTSTTNGATIDAWLWDFGDGSASTDQNPPDHTYTTSGTYIANLTIRNTTYDLTSTKLATINVNASIVADFAAAPPTSGYATLSVSFVDMSSPSDIFSWYWDFGDGSTSTYRNPTHSYTTPGVYNVSLTSTNPDGSDTEIKTDYITVLQSEDINPDSTLKFKSDLNIISNQTRYNRTVQISNVTSANWVNASILFNTSTIFITNIFANTTEYPDNTLVSSNIDNDGGSITFNVTKSTPYNPGSSSASIVDIELFQKAYALGNTSNSWGGGVLGNSTYNTTHPVTYFDYTPLYYGEWKTYSNFTISNFNPYISIDNVIFSPIPPSGSTANRWLWNFGDGNSFLDLNGTPVSHMYTTYASNATFYPSLTAYLNENTSVTNTTTLTISPVYANDYIVANFSGSPTTGSSGLLVTFTDLSIIGNRTNLIYNWTFGDGTYSSDSVNVLHVYSSVGIYTVKLTVTNDFGTSTETKANYIVISNQQTTTFYIPKTASFHVVDIYGNQIGGASLTAIYNGSTLPDTTISWLVSNYGMNTITSGEATNSALSMSGITSDSGDLTFVMIAPLEYDIYITYGGVTNHFFITTGSSNYQLKFVAPVAADTGLSTCVYANGNTHTGISSPDPYNMTFMWSYQDTCGLTTSIDYIVNDVDLGTTVYNYHLTPVTSGIYVNNYTVSNVRGKNYIWYENATRSV